MSLRLHLVPADEVAAWAATQQEGPLASWGEAVLQRLAQRPWSGWGAALVAEIERLYALVERELDRSGTPCVFLVSHCEADEGGRHDEALAAWRTVTGQA